MLDPTVALRLLVLRRLFRIIFTSHKCQGEAPGVCGGWCWCGGGSGGDFRCGEGRR